jgi:putative phosphoesterase
VLIAFISDIHGNLPALKAAVSDARKHGVDTIMCAGDITGYGPFPDEVCQYLEENGIDSITGNYDCKVLSVIEYGESAVAKISKKKRELLSWVAQHINTGAQQFLAGLPSKIERKLPGGHDLLMVHGSPVSNEDAIYPSITARALGVKLGEAHPDILVCGHSHIPFVKRIGKTLVINCGTAGHPVDGDPNPSYAILSCDKEAIHGHILRFGYDTDETIRALKKTSLPYGLQKDFAAGVKRRFL